MSEVTSPGSPACACGFGNQRLLHGGLELDFRQLVTEKDGEAKLTRGWISESANLDTGIDFRHELVLKYKDSKQITATKSWIQGRLGTVDNDGHSTHAASYVLKVAPQVELYVAKVFTDQSNSDQGAHCRRFYGLSISGKLTLSQCPLASKSPRRLPMQLRRMR